MVRSSLGMIVNGEVLVRRNAKGEITRRTNRMLTSERHKCVSLRCEQEEEFREPLLGRVRVVLMKMGWLAGHGTKSEGEGVTEV